MAAVLVLSVDAWYLALHIERRPVAAALHATDRLVERAVAVVVLAALDVARRGRYAGESGEQDAVCRRREADVGLALVYDRRGAHKSAVHEFDAHKVDVCVDCCAVAGVLMWGTRGRQPHGGCVEINE